MATHTLTTDSPAHNNRATQPPHDMAPGAADTGTQPLTVAALCREIGRRMRSRRRERGLSQEELGWRAGYHRTHISQIERGVCNPTLATLHHLALALEVPVATLCPGGATSSGEMGADR